MRPLNLPSKREPASLTSGARLLGWLAALVACWVLALPMAARTPAVRGMIERNRRLGIDPSAKFYSELPAMPRVRQRMEAVRAEGGDVFWQPWGWDK